MYICVDLENCYLVFLTKKRVSKVLPVRFNPVPKAIGTGLKK